MKLFGWFLFKYCKHVANSNCIRVRKQQYDEDYIVITMRVI